MTRAVWPVSVKAMISLQSESMTVFTALLHTDSTGVITFDSSVAMRVFK